MQHQLLGPEAVKKARGDPNNPSHSLSDKDVKEKIRDLRKSKGDAAVMDFIRKIEVFMYEYKQTKKISGERIGCMAQVRVIVFALALAITTTTLTHFMLRTLPSFSRSWSWRWTTTRSWVDA